MATSANERCESIILSDAAPCLDDVFRLNDAAQHRTEGGRGSFASRLGAVALTDFAIRFRVLERLSRAVDLVVE